MSRPATARRLSVLLALALSAFAWFGQRDGWRLPFLLISGLAALALVVVATLLPTTRPEESHGAYATATFDVGIALGALLGGLVLPAYGAEGAFALGGVVSLATLAVVLGEPLFTRRPTAARITA